MTDIVEIAKTRRALLAAEVARLDRFLRMAGALKKYEHGGYGSAMQTGAMQTGAVQTGVAQTGAGQTDSQTDLPHKPMESTPPKAETSDASAGKILVGKVLAAASEPTTQTPETNFLTAAAAARATTEPAPKDEVSEGTKDTSAKTVLTTASTSKADARPVANPDAPPEAAPQTVSTLAKRKAAGRFLDKALHFIGEEVTAKTVSVVPSTTPPAVTPPAATHTTAHPVVSSAIPPVPKRAATRARTAPADTIASADPDHFHFVDNTSSTEPATATGAGKAAEKPISQSRQGRSGQGRSGSVDIHIGQKLRQRRWMIGMSRQQLGDAVGVGLNEIRNYEMGTEHIDPSRLWQVAAALDVPMSYFFEEIGGQSDNEAVTGSVLTEAEARVVLPEQAVSEGIADQTEDRIEFRTAPKRAAS